MENDYDSLPKELKDNGLFCLFKIEHTTIVDKDGNTKEASTKIPYSINGWKAKSNDESTFCSFSSALSHIQGYNGLALGLFKGLSLIDIDHCIDENGAMSDTATDIVEQLDSYTEISPSGHGIHILFYNNDGFDTEKYYQKNDKTGVECYISKQTHRYATLTGNSCGTCNSVKEIPTEKLQPILDKYLKRTSIVKKKSVQLTLKADTSRISVWLEKDAKLNSLWNSKAPGSNSNESNLDESLCCKLAYYCECDMDAVNSLFMQSPYYKSKDELHMAKWDRKDYRTSTLEVARNIASQAIADTTQSNVKKISEYTLDDTGNARRFIDEFGKDLHYNIDNKVWMMWNGRYWNTDTSEDTRNLITIMTEHMSKQAVEQWLKDSKIPGNEKNAQSVFDARGRNIAYLRSKRGKDCCLAEAHTLAGVPVYNSDFDTDGELLCTDNGVVNLRTGEMMPFEREQMISKSTHCKCDMEHEPTKFVKFMKQVFTHHPEIYPYVQRLFGYGATNSLREQEIYFFIGDGNNGKSLMLDQVSKVLGDYSGTAKSTLITEQRNQNQSLTQIAQLKGKRFVCLEELDARDWLNEASVKAMTSGFGEIVGKYLYANEFTFKFEGKIFVASNYDPNISGVDAGIWRRVVKIPCDLVLRKDQVDKDLGYRLSEEREQILGWIVRGAVEYFKLGKLNPPACISRITSEYRTEQDKVLQWAAAKCDTSDSTAYEKSSDLYKSYSMWCRDGGEYVMSQTMFGRSMSRKFTKSRISSSIIYYGIRLNYEKYIDSKTAELARKYNDVKVDEEDI